MKRNSIYLLVLFLLVALSSNGQQSQKIIRIPGFEGFQTLKCDFHLHTVFSDGTVWPTIRVEEAWKEGLDAIAITDHIEYRPNLKDIPSTHNRSYEIALPLAKQLDILLVKSSEITRDMPPGHLNALFVTNSDSLDQKDVTLALQKARDQGAFILWNHPGWKAQQPDKTLWWKEHTNLYNSDLMHGIEVYNNNEYYPEALDWANEKNLTIICNTDAHKPIGMIYDLQISHRPMTLVFTKTRTLDGIKEALFAGRTAAYFDNTLMGKSDFMTKLFFASIQISDKPLQLKNKTSVLLKIENSSDLDFELALTSINKGFTAPTKVILKAGQITALNLRGTSTEIADTKTLKMEYAVKNIFTNSKNNLSVTFEVPNN